MAIHPATRTLRFAVLECLQLSEDISSVRGQFEQIFRDWLETSAASYNARRLSSVQITIHTESFDVCKGQYPEDPENFDAVIVTGSTASSYDDEHWVHTLEEWIQAVYNRNPDVKIFGGCFGHQIVSQALLGPSGVQVERSPHGWEIGVHEIALNQQFVAHFPQLIGSQNRSISCQFLHADHVKFGRGSAMPPDWINMGSSRLCAVQGMFQPGRVLTYQGHPEFDAFLNERGVRNLGAGSVITTKQVDALMPLIHQPDNAVVFGEILLAFLLD